MYGRRVFKLIMQGVLLSVTAWQKKQADEDNSNRIQGFNVTA